MNLAKERVLDQMKARFWLSSGTCLGWYRQCDIITYGKDVDFGVLIQDYDVRLIAAMQMNDMPIKHLFGKVNWSITFLTCMWTKDGHFKLLVLAHSIRTRLNRKVIEA